MKELEEFWSLEDLMQANDVLDAIEAAERKAQQEARR